MTNIDAAFSISYQTCKSVQNKNPGSCKKTLASIFFGPTRGVFSFVTRRAENRHLHAITPLATAICAPQRPPPPTQAALEQLCTLNIHYQYNPTLVQAIISIIQNLNIPPHLQFDT